MKAYRVIMVAIRLLTFLFIGVAASVFAQCGQWGMVMLCLSLFFAATYVFLCLKEIYDEVIKR